MAIPNPQPNIIDTIKSDNTTWSSNKISSEISSGAGDMIDDASITDAKTWSSYKINQEIPKELDHLLDVTITDPASGDVLIYNGTTEKFGNTNINYAIGKIVKKATLTAGNTSLIISDSNITANALIDIFTSDFDIIPTAVTTDNENHTVTLTFDAQASDVDVAVLIWKG